MKGLIEVVHQPNGKFAKFYFVWKDFVVMNLTDDEMHKNLMKEDNFTNSDAWSEIVRAKLNCDLGERSIAMEPWARWIKCISEIKNTGRLERVQEILDAVNTNT